MLENENIGCVGVLGGHCAMKGHSGHWSAGISSGSIIDGVDYLSQNEYSDFLRNKEFIPVALVDGLWMCFRKNIFEKIKWDEDNYEGFHCYDSDISMQVHAMGYEVCVINKVEIIHKSVANINDDFFENQRKWSVKWDKYLPVIVGISTIDLFSEYLKKKNAYESVLYSHAFKLGSILLKPVYEIKKLLK